MDIRILCLATLIATGISGYAQTEAHRLNENKAIVLRSESELWSKGNLAAADEMYSPDFICHFVVGPDWKGIEGIKREVASHRSSFPDWQEKVDDIIAEGDKVVIRFTSTGTQSGEFQGIAPSGRRVRIQEMAIFRLSNGKIVEQWGMPDVHGLIEQLTATHPGRK